MMITRRLTQLLRLALVGLLILLPNTSRAQKNTLYLWVDTVYIDPMQVDVTIDVKFKLDAQRSEVDFSGYVAEIDYGPSIYVTVTGGSKGVITENTGSRFFSDPEVRVYPDHVRIVALGAPIDTSYSSLFKIRMSAFLPTDGFGLPEGERAYFLWDDFESHVVAHSGIDTIIFGGGFVERRKTAPEPTFDTVRITLPAAIAPGDSSFIVPVIFDSIRGSKIRHFAFSFDYDSSVVQFDDAFMASDVVGTLTKVIQPLHGDIFVESKDSALFLGADTLFYLRFTARGRTDTLCTALTQVGFLPVNNDAKVDARIITVGEICVQGFNPGPKEAVRESEELRDLFISPNPASEIVTISLPEQKGRFSVSVFDAAGRSVHTAEGVGRIEWRPLEAAQGAYHVIVTLDGHSVLRRVIIK